MILVAEIDRAQIVRGKFDLDVVGHYARPDIFQLQVDERPKRPVTIQRGDVRGEKEKDAGAGHTFITPADRPDGMDRRR